MEKLRLQTDSLEIGYQGRTLVRDITLQVRPGEILVLIGPNGVGKSTLLKVLTRQLKTLSGTVFLDGIDLKDLQDADISRTMSVLMTERINPELMTCFDVASAGRYPYTGRFGLLTDDDRAKIDEAMELVGVSDLKERLFSQISDGQRQRVMLARAICQEPSVLVMDEPASFLDIRYKLDFLELTRTLSRERQVAVVMTLHELELAKYIADTIACVRDGRIDRVGTPEEIFTGGYIQDLYGVRSGLFREIYGALDLTGPAGPAGEQAAKEVHAAVPEGYVRSGSKLLRCGFTTGTCAALAAAGAARLLFFGETPSALSLMTDYGLRADIQPEYCRMEEDGSALCAIRKDAGDDPDITDGALVTAAVSFADGEGIVIEGGEGVGRVTRPGLDQPVGEAAINRVPRRMITEQVEQVCALAGYSGGIRVVIGIPGGEELAKKTFNPQLGIEGGLSVLGTSGVVAPMSEQALIDTIEVSVRQAVSEGHRSVILTPGNYGMDFIRQQGLDRLSVPVIKCSNFLGEALDIAVSEGVGSLLLTGHIGKLVKLAGGIMQTHSGYADCRMELFTAHAALCGAPQEVCRALMDAATTDACLDILKDTGLDRPVTDSLLAAMQEHLALRLKGAVRAGVFVFSNRHGVLGMTKEAAALLDMWKEEAHGTFCGSGPG